MATKILSADNWQEEIVNAGKPALVDFWATWCPHCKRLAPTVEKVADEYDGKLVVGKVDTDENPGLAQQYKVEYLPTFLLLAADGTVLDTIISPANKAAIDEFIAKNVQL
ncbi:MAG: thioredoxin [Clostridia bacterium]|nr:thioredoxin [Clostridia bacterium]